jgi:hypothetical protein
VTIPILESIIPQGKYGKIAAVDSDIGGQLLPILSKGLYTNPLDCIREYVQNSVDADAKSVSIKITGNSVIIHDTGHGMDKDQLLSSRKFGISAKDLSQHVGFRGIGIYSGYDLSKRLIITTKRADTSQQLIMRFDFAAMKKELEKKASGTVSLSALLTDFTTFKSEVNLDTAASFTTVQLEDISETHLRKIANRAELRKYILQNLPVDFAATFEYRDKIIEKLRENVPGFKAVAIELQSDNEQDEVVSQPPLTGLEAPEFKPIEGTDGRVVGYLWACLNKANRRLDAENLELTNKDSYGIEEYQGFVYKCKGFTIGTRNHLNPMFKAGSGTLYRWYTGEIYVVDDQVIPNTARDDFESNSAKTRLEIAVRKELGLLEAAAENRRERANADSKVEESLVKLNALSVEINKSGIDSFDDFSKLKDLKTSIKRYRAKSSASVKERSDLALKLVEKLDKEIRSSVGKSTSGLGKSTARKKEALSLPFPIESSTTTIASKTLLALIESLDLFDSDNCKRIVAAIDSSLIGIMGTESLAYKRLVESVELALEEEQ